MSLANPAIGFRPSGSRAVWVAVLFLACSKSAVVPATNDSTADAQVQLPDVDAAAAVADAVPGDAFKLGNSDAPVRLPEVPLELTCGTGKAPGNAGCGFYAAEPPLDSKAACYAMFVVNPGIHPAKLTLEHAGGKFSLAKVARLPRGGGTALVYQPFDEAAGLAPGDVAILFLSGPTAAAPGPAGQAMDFTGATTCPFGTSPAYAKPTGIRDQSSSISGIGQAFHLTSDRPVVAYDINPYGGSASYVTSASLLLPVETWARNTMVATPVRFEAVGNTTDYSTYALIIAAEDDTEVAIKPSVPLAAGMGVAATPAGGVARVRLKAGQFVQFMEESQVAFAAARKGGLSGSRISADKPIAVIGGSPCADIPVGTSHCDGVHQQVPPIGNWGHEYAAVRYRSRIAALEEPVPWQIVAAVDGTVLTYAPRAPAIYPEFPEPAPTQMSAGQVVQFWTAEPFVVSSQDADHPIYVAGHMTGEEFLAKRRTRGELGAGDPEFVNVIPTAQYQKDYTFFTDPTYSESTLVVVRTPDDFGRFADVRLACAAAPIANWMPVGRLEFARVDITTKKFQPVIPGCDNGAQKMSSALPFGVTVWGWGTVESGNRDYSAVSYGYPAGAALVPVTTVSITVD